MVWLSRIPSRISRSPCRISRLRWRYESNLSLGRSTTRIQFWNSGAYLGFEFAAPGSKQVLQALYSCFYVPFLYLENILRESESATKTKKKFFSETLQIVPGFWDKFGSPCYVKPRSWVWRAAPAFQLCIWAGNVLAATPKCFLSRALASTRWVTALRPPGITQTSQAQLSRPGSTTSTVQIHRFSCPEYPPSKLRHCGCKSRSVRPR
jgi:hypothetical protein